MADGVEDVNLELSKILAKTMQSSYKKKEIRETIERILEKVDGLVISQNTYDPQKINQLRKEFEEIRRDFYGLK